MNSYYLTLVLKPDLEEKERKAVVDGVVKRLTSKDGKMIKEDLWGARDLAYPIKRQTKGFYAHFEIQADPKNTQGLDKSLKVEENLIRYLLVRV